MATRARPFYAINMSVGKGDITSVITLGGLKVCEGTGAVLKADGEVARFPACAQRGALQSEWHQTPISVACRLPTVFFRAACGQICRQPSPLCVGEQCAYCAGADAAAGKMPVCAYARNQRAGVCTGARHGAPASGCRLQNSMHQHRILHTMKSVMPSMKSAFVTGAATGIGEGLVNKLQAEGWRFCRVSQCSARKSQLVRQAQCGCPRLRHHLKPSKSTKQ